MADSLDTELQMMWKRIYAQCQTIAQQEVLRLFGSNVRGGALNPGAIQSGTSGQILTTSTGGQTVWAAAPTGNSLELTDGTHDLTAVTKITVSGAVVGGTSAAATLTISGGTTLSTALVSTPPLETDLVTALGTPSAVGRQITQINDQGLERHEYLVLSDGTAFWSTLLAKARLASSTATSTNAASPLTTPTYDGSGQAVEPCVLYFPTGWPATGTSYPYWMAVTPYPGGAAAYENPSLLVSTDGTTWSVPAGVTNPIVAAPGTGNNDNPWLLVDGTGTMWYYYEVQTSTQGTLYVISSTDGVHWSAPTTLFTVTGGPNGALSPSVVYDGTEYHLWTVNGSGNPYTLQHATCATPDGTFSTPTTCTVNGLPTGTNPFHVSVYKRGAVWQAFLVICTSGTGGTAAELWFAESTDGLTWTLGSAALVAPSVSGWDDSLTYRASGVPTATGYDLWYSADNTSAVWHIGRTTVSLNTRTLENMGRLIVSADTTAMVESFGGTLEEDAIAYATDTGRFGIYSGGQWHWSASVTDLPALATDTTAGLVRPDGSTITVAAGVLTAQGGTPYSPLVDPATPDLIWDPTTDVIVGPD